MTSEQPPDSARSRRAARSYAQGRPGYPRAAADWLVGGQARTVLELGAGTGQLTAQLVAAGHDLHATDPDPHRLAVLSERLPGVRTSQASAEEIEVPDRSVDVVVCAASFHHFDAGPALTAIARVLRPGGHLAVVWNEPDARIPWVRRLSRILDGPRDENEAIKDLLVHSPLFSFVEDKTFKAWQDINAETVRDVVVSSSAVSKMTPEDQEDRVAEVLDLYAEYGRGMDGMQLPYLVQCLRTQVVHQPGLFHDGSTPDPSFPDIPFTSGSSTGNEPGSDDDAEAARAERSRQNFLSDGTDTDMLLIDFR